MTNVMRALRCSCMCSNCRDAHECLYSSRNCQHAAEDGLERGAYEAKGFCVKTGYVPTSSRTDDGREWAV